MIKLFDDLEKQVTKPLEIVYLSVCSPMKNMSVGGAKYFIIFLDDFLKNVWVYMMKSIREWFERFKEFRAFVEKQSKHEIKAFLMDEQRELHFKND